jgi:glycosyltransferase involved in cell wall biosynthesis
VRPVCSSRRRLPPLRRLIDDRTLREQYGAAGADRARHTFSLRAHVERLEAIYSDL